VLVVLLDAVGALLEVDAAVEELHLQLADLEHGGEEAVVDGLVGGGAVDGEEVLGDGLEVLGVVVGEERDLDPCGGGGGLEAHAHEAGFVVVAELVVVEGGHLAAGSGAGEMGAALGHDVLLS
jgi:hypothetical protein